MRPHLSQVAKATERVVLAGVMLSGDDETLFEQDMQEMEMLCATAGVTIVARVVQKRDTPVSSTYIGSGKLTEIRALMTERESDTLIIDALLSPGQVRNIEEEIKGKVLDRSQLILDIFARHAATTESRIQVELAQMRTLYPRLTRAWTHFSRQFAGVGTKGPGEKQLEVDRRLVQKRIADLSHRLKDIDKVRSTQRKSRRNTARVTLVGYTNVGKSSLLNRLTHSQTLVENKLFATLDTTTRRMFLQGLGEVVLSDTVGFLRKLPHHLVASFKSTLEEALDTDVLLVVMDASSPWALAQSQTVDAVLGELASANPVRLAVLNKCDLVPEGIERKKLELAWSDASMVSAQSGEGIEALKQRIADAIAQRRAGPAFERMVERKAESYRERDELPGPPPPPVEE